MKLASLCYVHDTQTNTVLMIHRNKKANDPHEGHYNGLGGKFEEGESPLENVTREVFEESGLKIENPTLKGVITFPNNYGNNESWHVFVYVATQFSGELADCNEGTLEWIPKEQLLSIKTHEADKHFLSWLDTAGVFEVKFLYDEQLRLQDYILHRYGE